METMVERCAGLGVHTDSVTACLRLPAEGGGRRQEIAEFRATTAGLLALRDWPVAEREPELRCALRTIEDSINRYVSDAQLAA